MEINKGQPNENRERLFIQSLLSTASESATVICTLAETQRQAEGWESFIMGKERRLQVYPDWGLLAGGTGGRLTRSRASDGWLGIHTSHSLVGPKLETETNQESCQLLIKSWPYGAGCYRGYFGGWGVGPVTRDRGLTHR